VSPDDVMPPGPGSGERYALRDIADRLEDWGRWYREQVDDADGRHTVPDRAARIGSAVGESDAGEAGRG
jgi:hypothetical protein